MFKKHVVQHIRHSAALCGTMLFGKNSMHIGMKVSNCCSIIARLLVSILLPMKKLLSWKKMLCSGNMILCRLAKCCDAIIFALAAKFHLEPHDVVRVLRTAFGFIFLNYFSHYYVFLYHFVCVIVCVLFLFMLHSCVLN